MGDRRMAPRMVASWLAALWLGLIAPASVPEALGDGGEVVVDALEVLVEADDSGYASGEMKRGDRVEVVGSAGRGWLAIVPPSGSFDWVDASAIRDDGDGRGLIVAARASIRSGVDGARMPGPPRPALPDGTIIRLLDRPPLILGTGARSRSWRAIAPTEGEVRYVRVDGVKLDPRMTSKANDPGVRPAQVDPGGVTGDPVSAFEQALRRSRRIDSRVDEVRTRLNLARTGTERSYDARGLLQASSRKIDGQKVHALIGPEGTPIAYLAIPPGIPASRMLTRKVGVRGDVRFNESLGARLITVRDLDPLDQPR